jgi:hypothetical protein
MPLHLCFADSAGNVWHRLLTSSGWTLFGDVVAEVLREHPGSWNPGATDQLDCAVVAGELQVSGFRRGSDALWHVLRHSDGTWTAFGDVNTSAAAGVINKAFFEAITVTEFNGALALGAAAYYDLPGGQGQSPEARLRTTSRASSGSWTAWRMLGGSHSTLDSANVSGSLHFCGVLYDASRPGLDFVPWHDIPTSTTISFNDVRTQVLSEHPGSEDPGAVSGVSCAAIGAELHYLAVGRDDGRLWHTIRRANGTWFEFGNVRRVVLGDNPGTPDCGPVLAVSCAAEGSELHVVVAIRGARQLWHTIRRATTRWSPFDPLHGALPGNAGSPVSVAIATA